MAGIPVKISFNILNLEQFKEVANILSLVVTDERIPADIRNEYTNQFNNIQWETEKLPII